MAITTKPPASPGVPNSKTTISESTAGNPTSKTTVSEAAAGNPASKTTISEASAGNPTSKTTIAEDSAGSPTAKTTIAESTAGNPTAKTTIPAAGFPRALIPLVDMHFDTQSYSQQGNPVLFDDLFTYSRNSSATFINRRIVNNKAEFFLDTDFVGTVTNLLTFSEQFDNASWTKTRASIIANSTTAPDGTLTADTLVEDSTASSTHTVDHPSISFTSGNQYTVSFFAKAKERTECFIKLNDSAFPAISSAIFNIQAGVLIDSGSGLDSTSIESAGNGWFRCSVTATADATLSSGVEIRPSVGGTSVYSGDGSSGIYIHGAQVVQNAKQQPYVKTISSSDSDTFTESLRVEYDPVTGENLGALIEGASTNLFLRSEEFDNASWTKLFSTVTANAIEAPDGTTSMDILVEDSSNNVHRLQQGTSVTSGLDYTLSTFVKAKERFRVRLDFQDSGFPTTANAKFNLSDQTAVPGSGTTATIKEITDGIFRISITATANATVTAAFFIDLLDDSGTETYLGDGSSGMYVWGAQAEQQSLLTSYIRTEGSTVARVADDLELSAFGNFVEIQGAVFCEYNIVGPDIANQYVWSIDDNSANNRLTLLVAGTPRKLRTLVQNGGSVNADYSSTTTILDNIKLKSLVNYGSVTIETFLDGVSVGSDSAFNIPNGLPAIHIGQDHSSAEMLFGHIRKFTIYDEELTVQEVTLL